jgi:Fe-Mn family superoxide dismutase
MAELTPLPWPLDSLEPALSAEAIQLHHGVIQNAYVDKLNRAGLSDVPLAELERRFTGPLQVAASQILNHELYWASMIPRGGGPPRDPQLHRAIIHSFGNWGKFLEAWTAASTHMIGSGWLWLTAGPGGALGIELTPNGQSPRGSGRVPLIVCDLWEHAYLLDWGAARTAYATTFLSDLVSWRPAELALCHLR